jgi:tetratricopeptide (TPR) repeat protein
MSTAIRSSLAALLLFGLLAGGGALYVRRDLAAAQRLLTRGEPREAQKSLKRYLHLYRNDNRARLALAEALVADDDRPAEDAARDAIAQLDRIPDDSPLGAEARTRAGRLVFLILLRPGDAELQFRKAISLKPDALDPHIMLWNLLNVTGRFHLTQPVFWKIYELSPTAERPLRLRDWYLSEFGRGTAFAELDRKLGVLAKDASPSMLSEYHRLRNIRLAQPDWPAGTAALARMLRDEGYRELALQVLDLAGPEAIRDPYFLATRIQIAMDAGEFDEATDWFTRWPEPHEGFEYWFFRGTIADEIRRDDAEAIFAYQQALKEPLGDTDWQMLTRLAHCLLRSGRAEEARTVRELGERLSKLMERELHKELRKAFIDLHNPDSIRQIIDFYRQLGRDREVAEWNAWLEHLAIEPSNSPDPPSPVNGKLPTE